jgi:hypothetical protein
MKSCLAVLLAAVATAASASLPSIIGDGWGLDHVLVGVPGSDVARDVFEARLGFSVIAVSRFPVAGLEHAIVPFPPAAYVELFWAYQAPTGDVRPIHVLVRKKIVAGGGLAAYYLDVSPFQPAAEAMRSLGLKVSLPASPIVQTPDGKQAPGRWQYIDIDPEDQAQQPLGVPGGPGVGFLEYESNSDRLKPERFQRALERAAREAPDSRRPAGEIHANTARKLRSVWVAVPSVAAAVKQAARFSFAAEVGHFVALGETAQAVHCGQGTIVFFEPAHRHSPLAEFVRMHGLGPFGFSVEVADLKTALDVVQQGTDAKLTVQRVDNRTAFIVPAESAAGTFIEFVQQ